MAVVIGEVLNRVKRLGAYGQLRKFIKYGVRYGNFSFNLNSRRYWDAKLSRYEDFWRNENYYHVLDLLPRDTSFSLLDIGCALGDGCELLQIEFPHARISGADISEIGVAKARRKNERIDYSVLDVLKDDIPDMYDYITIIETLEHFDKPFHVVDKCLKHVQRSLIISTPYSSDAPSGKVSGVGEHRYLFNEDTFKGYRHRVAKITTYVEATKGQCIVYEIEP